MRTFFLFIAFVFFATGIYAQPGKYAGTKKSLIGKFFTDSRNLTALKGWTYVEGGLANSLNDPEWIMSHIFRKGTTYIVFYSIMEDTATGKSKVADVLEITGVTKGWTVRSSFCRQNKVESNYIIAWGKETSSEYMKLIKKAWIFDPDKRRIIVIPVKGIDCENIGC